MFPPFLPLSWVLVPLFLLWAITPSHAFQGFGVLRLSSSMGPSTSMTFGHTYRFPTIPYGEGIKHIHTLEHLQNVSARRNSQPNGRPYFSIERVAPPVRYGEYVSVSVHCLVLGIPQTICMLSRPGMENTSTFMCLRDGIQQAMIQLRVGELGSRGHTLSVESTYFTSRRLLDAALEPVMRFLRFFETRARHRGIVVHQHPNLMWYRRMVLGLIASEGALGLD